MSKATLKKEMKNTELTAKEKELQVVYEELESALGIKTGKGMERFYDGDRDYNDPLYYYSDGELESPEFIDRERRFKAAYQYLKENFSASFLKKSSVKPGPLFAEVEKQKKIAEAIQNAAVEPVFQELGNPSLGGASQKKAVPLLSEEERWYQEVKSWRERAEQDFKDKAQRRKDAQKENDAWFVDASIKLGIGWALQEEKRLGELTGGSDFVKDKKRFLDEKRNLEMHREFEKMAKDALDPPITTLSWYSDDLDQWKKKMKLHDLSDDNMEKIELSPYKQRLQKMIKERLR